MKVAGDRVGRFAPCPKCGQTLAIAENRVEPSAEHTLISPDRPPRFEPAVPNPAPVVALSVAGAAALVFFLLSALAPQTAEDVARFVGSPVLTNILLCLIAALLWSCLRRR